MKSSVINFQVSVLAALVSLGAVAAENSTNAPQASAAVQPSGNVFPIDLPTALKLAGAQSLDLQIAREKLREAEGEYSQARLKYFPWITPGIGYRRHDGNVQDIAGAVFTASKQSYTVGVGLTAQIELGDAIYDSLAKRKLAEAGVEGAEAARQDALLDAAAAYLELARAQASIGVAREALRISTDYATQVKRAVEAGIAYKGDALRADVQRRQNEIQIARLDADRLSASARLVQALRLEPGTELVAQDNELVPTTLVEPGQALDSLLAKALNSRPELRELALRLESAQAQRKGATTGPWIPTIGGFATLGGLGGGRNDDWGNFDAFGDYGIGLSWKIGRGGLLDKGMVTSADARARVVELEQLKRADIILREVVEARNLASSLQTQIGLLQESLDTSKELLQLSLDRKEFGVGAVLEAVQAEQELTTARLDLLRRVADFNLAQWELHRAVGVMAEGDSR